MATITIKDLSENLDLDRKAMQSIMGGSRLGASSGSQVRRAGVRAAGAGPVHSPQIVDFKTGVASRGAPARKTG
jgi:hypothetical protein